MIAVHNISFQIGKQRILHNLNFQVQAGALTIVLGQNGAGKSTLLRILSGEQKPSEGKVMLGDDDMHTLSVRELAFRRAVLSQQYNTTLPFTCEEIVMMGRYPHFKNQPSQADHQIVQACMEEMQVHAFAKRSWQTLSGGEQQRVQMARVLAQLKESANATGGFSRKLLLLDEPTASLDCLYQQLCLSKARELAAQGYAVLVILHDLNLAAQFADRIILLKQGKIIAAGTPRDVLQPDPIAAAYDIDVDVVENEGYDFPILLPAAHRNKPVLMRS